MASSTGDRKPRYLETYTLRPATDLDCLKYIIDTFATDDEVYSDDDIASEVLAELTKLDGICPITEDSAKKAVDYVKSVIASLIPTALRLRSRVQELPEEFGERKNVELHAERIDEDVGGGLEEDRLQEPGDGETPSALANQLVELIKQRKYRENEIRILEDELRS